MRLLRELHLRWWHASAFVMVRTLRLAGMPKIVLDDVPRVIDTCRSCCKWARPLPASVASVNVPTEFNQHVEGDLMFYHKYIIVHFICRTTRWRAAMEIQSKQWKDIVDAFNLVWLTQHGPPKGLLFDGEKAVGSDEALQFFKANGIHFHKRAKGQHCRYIERRTAILRHNLHTTDEQLMAEVILQFIPFPHRLSNCVFAGNALISVNGVTPYNAVYGRQPTMLPDLDSEVPGGIHGHVQRVREICIQKMIEGTAADRVRRALNTKTLPSHQMMDF